MIIAQAQSVSTPGQGHLSSVCAGTSEDCRSWNVLTSPDGLAKAVVNVFSGSVQYFYTQRPKQLRMFFCLAAFH